MAVAVGTLKPDVFSALRTLINNNLPTYSYGGVTQTYNLTASYHRDNPAFPMIVLNESNVKFVLLNLDGSGEDYMIQAQLDFYAKELHGQKAVGTAQSQLLQTFINNITVFNDDDGLVPREDFWEDSTITVFIDNNQILHHGSSIVGFKLR